MITSINNPKIKYIRRLLRDRRFRHREGNYIVEGSRWLEELFHHKVSPEFILISQSFKEKERFRSFFSDLPAGKVIDASDSVMAYMSDTVTASGILAVVPITNHPVPAEKTFLLILDGISNPGNLGTILRTAAAANVDAVLLAPGCVDLYNPKVLRGSMGAHLRIPVLEFDWSDIARETSQMSIWIASVGNGLDYLDVNWNEKVTIIIGGEASGASVQARSLTTQLVSIPLGRDMESLNAAVATGILLFEVVRQRRVWNGF